MCVSNGIASFAAIPRLDSIPASAYPDAELIVGLLQQCNGIMGMGRGKCHAVSDMSEMFFEASAFIIYY